jgi:heterodisulfide reductase subunit A
MMKTASGILNKLSSDTARLRFPEISRKTFAIQKVAISPCRQACPIDTDVKAYLGLIAVGKFEKALAIVKRDNPLPGICGRVCVHPCETDCSRNEVDQPLAICALKRFLADYELKKGRKKQDREKIVKKEKVAVIGSGPAGLTAANDLIRLGYKVVVFEALPVAGGMLSVGIPEYRLPRQIIETEIDAIRELGVQIKTNRKIRDLGKLKKQGYQAIFLAVGAYKGLKLRIPGEDEFKGFLDCIAFLVDFSLGKPVKIGKKVIVIGGGNAAIDSARTALRLGSDVHIVYRRSRKEMPANEWEIEEAEKEGVKIHYLASPVRILGEKGKVAGMECIKNKLGPPDASGRQRPVPIKGSEFKIDADTIIPAISQQPDLSFLESDHGLEISKWNSFVVNEKTLETNMSGVFAGGDCVTGPKTVIEAIAAGHTAAVSIDTFLQGKGRTTAHSCVEKTRLRNRAEFEVVVKPTTKTERIAMPELPLNRRRNFKEVELGLSPASAMEEAHRCLRCGLCAECIECIPDCDNRLSALSLADKKAAAHTGAILVRVPFDREQFPLSNNIIHGELSGGGTGKAPVLMQPIIATVRQDFCRGCGNCVEVCEYSAPALTSRENGMQVSKIDELKCKGCGVCVSVCPSGAITLTHFGDQGIEKLIEQACSADASSELGVRSS